MQKMLSNGDLAKLRLKLITASQMAGTLNECNDPNFTPVFIKSAKRAISELQRVIDKVTNDNKEPITPTADKVEDCQSPS